MSVFYPATNNSAFVERMLKMPDIDKNPPVELEEAIKLLAQHAEPIKDTRMVPLIDACGLVAAEEIVSAFDNPPFNRSPLDGYAFCHKDSKGASKGSPARLKLVHEIFAGDAYEGKVARGQAICVMTGGMIPDGFDCVIRQEDVNCSEDEVEIYTELKKHENFCFKGEDIRQGQQLLRQGDVIHYIHLGILSSMGIAEVKTIRPAKVGLMCTGSEIVPIGSPLTPGKIYDSNLYMLAGRIKDLGLAVVPFSPVPDDVFSIAARIDVLAHDTDVIITTGGVSVGKKDMMHEVFSMLNANKIFWRVSMKPGTHALCGVYKNKLIICLSGNPFAASVTFELLARPVLAILASRDSLNYTYKKALLKSDFNKASGSRRFIRAKLVDGDVYLNPGLHSSGALLSMLGCNALVDIPEGSPPLKSGTVVDVVEL